MVTKRVHLTRNETLEVMRFVADVAARKAEPDAQRQFLIDGILHLGAADAGFSYFAGDWRTGGRAPRLMASTVGAGSDALFATYVREVIESGGGVEADPYCVGTLPLDVPLVSVTRREVVPDRRTERRFGDFAEWGHQARVGDGHICFARLDRAAGKGRPGQAVGVGIHRLDGGLRPFAECERARVRMAIGECAGLVARGHMPPPEDGHAEADPMAGLPPRPRAVLEWMLRGHTPKRIAHELGIGVYTVREYQTTIYRHFGVGGRDELMAKFVRP